MSELELILSAQKIVKDVIGVRQGDKVLVVTDEAKLKVGKVFLSACQDLGAESVLALMPLDGEHGNEPPGYNCGGNDGCRYSFRSNHPCDYPYTGQVECTCSRKSSCYSTRCG